MRLPGSDWPGGRSDARQHLPLVTLRNRNVRFVTDFLAGEPISRVVKAGGNEGGPPGMTGDGF